MKKEASLILGLERLCNQRTVSKCNLPLLSEQICGPRHDESIILGVSGRRELQKASGTLFYFLIIFLLCLCGTKD